MGHISKGLSIELLGQSLIFCRNESDKRLSLLTVHYTSLNCPLFGPPLNPKLMSPDAGVLFCLRALSFIIISSNVSLFYNSTSGNRNEVHTPVAYIDIYRNHAPMHPTNQSPSPLVS